MIWRALICLMLAGPAAAATPVCFERTWAEVKHSHRDLGQGRVLWVWSWSAEGVADDLHIAECAESRALTARLRSERMQEAIPYDRRTRAREVVDRALSAPHFFRLGTLAEALNDIRVPARLAALEKEPCACAVFYPGAFGTKGKTMRDQ